MNDHPEVVLDVVNRYTFRDLSHLEWTWNVTTDYAVEPIASGRFDVDGKTIVEGLKLPMKQVVTKVTKEAKKAGHPIKVLSQPPWFTESVNCMGRERPSSGNRTVQTSV